MTTTPPSVELAWSVEEDMPPGPYPRDSRYVFHRVPQLLTRLATAGRPARVLEVACGLGGQLALLRERADQVWGVDASFAVARHCGGRFAGDGGTTIVCGAAEQLPFRSRAFDSVICQGSLDHFARPRAFMGEVARLLTPDGRAVIGLSNFDSLSCRLGRTLYRLDQRLGRPVYRGRNYWQIPPNHTFHGNYAALRTLGAPHLELVACYGVSLLWLFHRWTKLIEALPDGIAWSTLAALDRVAYFVPEIADVMISVWRRAGDAHAPSA